MLQNKIKSVDHYWNANDRAWRYEDSQSEIPAEAVQPVGSSAASSDDWKEFCFVVVREIPDPRLTLDPTIRFKIVVKSPHLHKACKDIMGNTPGLSWNSDSVELDPLFLIACFPVLEEHHAALRTPTRSDEEEEEYAALGALLDWLRANYRTTLHKLENLIAHGEITFDLLYGILVPGTILVTRDHATGELRAAQLVTHTRRRDQYIITCQGVEAADARKHAQAREHANDGYDDEGTDYGDSESEEEEQTSTFEAGGRAFGTYNFSISVPEFAGTQMINCLNVYPMVFHPDPEGLSASLIKRGRKWASLNGVHHVHYQGLAGYRTVDSYIRYSVTSRIMIDRGNFVKLEPNYAVPRPGPEQIVSQLPAEPGTVWTHEKEKSDFGLTDDDLLLATPILYGFSLADKLWLEFNVELVTPISWNPETFEGLVLPSDRKNLLRSLVEAHDSDSGFDDFVRGKGQGLVINLFGPPGVGKTLSAEATSEHIRRPLYVVSSGDLGTQPSKLDKVLERIFNVATCWNAIVLIDEADVFLERRSLHDMERNAMVAVFLRHVEYYRGILFLTTNRITTFDEAFLSRIHVALHFDELTTATKVQIWRAFLKKAGVMDGEVSEELLAKLAAHNVNGRQIKNACRTARSLARSRSQMLGSAHLEEALNAMEDFVAEFAAMQA
ncbi:P-loop containing nucleoside triphosphate hydrolase protein [Ganoderma leucocontextum]|nr:P-loop containing nucleoside triphosphate hydrolase protein [Ganoderma leucocontextum]